jgi:hypothetical protein
MFSHSRWDENLAQTRATDSTSWTPIQRWLTGALLSVAGIFAVRHARAPRRRAFDILGEALEDTWQAAPGIRDARRALAKPN